jgi:hypothetical protein
MAEGEAEVEMAEAREGEAFTTTDQVLGLDLILEHICCHLSAPLHIQAACHVSRKWRHAMLRVQARRSIARRGKWPSRLVTGSLTWSLDDPPAELGSLLGRKVSEWISTSCVVPKVSVCCVASWPKPKRFVCVCVCLPLCVSQGHFYTTLKYL